MHAIVCDFNTQSATSGSALNQYIVSDLMSIMIEEFLDFPTRKIILYMSTTLTFPLNDTIFRHSRAYAKSRYCIQSLYLILWTKIETLHGFTALYFNSRRIDHSKFVVVWEDTATINVSNFDKSVIFIPQHFQRISSPSYPRVSDSIYEHLL